MVRMAEKSLRYTEIGQFKIAAPAWSVTQYTKSENSVYSSYNIRSQTVETIFEFSMKNALFTANHPIHRVLGVCFGRFLKKQAIFSDGNPRIIQLLPTCN